VSQVDVVAPGLRRWTAWHEEWQEPVASVAVDTESGIVLIDPLDPPRGLARPDHVLLTVYWHIRSVPELTADEVWASRRGARPLRNRGVRVTRNVEDDALPGGIRAFPTARSSEVVYWLPDQKAVVIGDVLLGAGAKPRPSREQLRLCPPGWLGKATHEALRESLRPLLDLPVQRVLVSHGEPVVRGGRKALERVLA
jgi:glyoxylase-like metal-dependent hydrolase (beta-lactamase superfamily II)